MSRLRGAFRPRRAGCAPSCSHAVAVAFAVGLAALSAAGCSSEGAGARNASGARGNSTSAEEAEAAPVTIGNLCPSCTPSDTGLLAGGESSDFEGDTPECVSFLRRRNVGFDEAQAAGIDIARVLPLVTREFTMPLRWGEGELEDAGPAPAGAIAPSGFSTETTLHGVVGAASEIELADLDPARCDAASVCTAEDGSSFDCAWYLASISSALDLTLELDTADASIASASLSARLWLTRGDPQLAPVADFVGDLSLARGTLRVTDGVPEPHTGSLRALLGFWPTAVRGVLTPVLYLGRIVQQGVRDGDELRVLNWSYAPLSASWPGGDACDPSEFPIDDESSEGRAALERLTTEYPAAQARVNDTSPQIADWFVAPRSTVVVGRTRARIELIGEPLPTCVSSYGEPHFEGDVRVWTEDQRVDWTLPIRAELQRRPGKETAVLFRGGAHFAPDSQFWSSSLQGVDLLGAPGADVSLRGGRGLDGSVLIFGDLEVQAVPACDRDPRCPSVNSPDAACAECGTEVNVSHLRWATYPVER